MLKWLNTIESITNAVQSSPTHFCVWITTRWESKTIELVSAIYSDQKILKDSLNKNLITYNEINTCRLLIDLD